MVWQTSVVKSTVSQFSKLAHNNTDILMQAKQILTIQCAQNRHLRHSLPLCWKY